MNDETKKFDVLAEIQLAVDVCAANGLFGTGGLLLQVHNAISELIDADREYDVAWKSTTRHSRQQRESAGMRRASALARIGGAV